MYKPISFLLLLLYVLCPLYAYASKRVALVIGNSNYSASPLKNPKNDANDIAKALKRLDFEVILATNADKRKMVSSINKFSSALRTAEIGFFFYAGHGMQIHGSNYLIPVGVEVKTASDVEFEAVHAGRILGKMEEAGNKLNIVVLDACRNNPFRSYFRSGDKGLAKMDAPVGTVIAYATGPGSVAADGRGRNGLYTKHLLQSIEKLGLSVQQMFNQTGLGVMQETNRKQVPWVSNTPIQPVYLAGGFLENGNKKNDKKSNTVSNDTGTLKIISKPSGATVFIDGNRAGESPVELGDMVAGNKIIRVEKSGYATEEKHSTIRKGKRSVVLFDLEEQVLKGWLTISTSAADAKVRILNVSSRYRDNMALDPGSYNVEVTANGYETKQQWVELEAGDYLDIDISLRKARAPQSRSFTESVTGMNFLRIPGGCFVMGQTRQGKKQLIKDAGQVKYDTYYNDEFPRHEVCVDDFYMGKYEVTVGQWREFTRDSHYKTDAENNGGGKAGCYSFKKGDNSKWRAGRDWESPGFAQSASQPVACVSHNDVTAFIRWLNRQGSKEFRLPTEAEWEYAARANTQTVRYWGNDPDDACKYGNVADQTDHKGTTWTSGHKCNDGYFFSAPVGKFMANQFGLYDMLGNVWEWCSDRHGSDYYKSSPRNNPQGPSSDSGRVIRGGAWNDWPAQVRAADRRSGGAASRTDDVGFRLVSSGQ